MVNPADGAIDPAVAPGSRRTAIVSMTVVPVVTVPGLTPVISGAGLVIVTIAASGTAGRIRPAARRTRTLRTPPAAVDDTETVSERTRPSAAMTGGLAAEMPVAGSNAIDVTRPRSVPLTRKMTVSPWARVG